MVSVNTYDEQPATYSVNAQIELAHLKLNRTHLFHVLGMPSEGKWQPCGNMDTHAELSRNIYYNMRPFSCISPHSDSAKKLTEKRTGKKAKADFRKQKQKYVALGRCWWLSVITLGRIFGNECEKILVYQHKKL